MNSWVERVRALILAAVSPVRIVAGDQWGVRRLLLGLREPDLPLIYVDLRTIDCADSVSVGNGLSEALRRGLGSAIFGLGVNAEYAFGALASFLPALEPVTIAVTAAEVCPAVVERLVDIVRPPNRLVIHSRTDIAATASPASIGVVRESSLKLTLAEALELYGAERDRSEIERALGCAGGALVAIEQELGLDRMVRDSGHPLDLADTEDARGDPSAVVDALVSHRRWREAFEFAIDHAPTRVPEVLDEAGNAYFEAGEFDRFWRFISGMPKWLSRQEQPMYWLFNAAIAVNEWRKALPAIDRYLETHEAPDLRALRATVELNDRSLAEAQRAHAARKSPDTAKALAFNQEFQGELGAAVDLYKEAIELAEAEGRPRHAVGAAAGMAQSHSFAGAYERARYWGDWALRQYQSYELQEELLRLFVVSVAAYPRLLVGAVKSARQVLDTVRVNELMLGIPSLEGVLSTLGDLAVVEGRVDDAIRFYEMNLRAASATLYPSIANDLVQALLLAGDTKKAKSVAMQAAELASIGPEFQRPLADLSLGSVLSRGDWNRGEELLWRVLDSLKAHPMGPLNARAVLNLGRSLLRRGCVEDARRLVRENGQYLRELGDSGWLLQGGDGPEIAQLKALFRSDEPAWKIQLLGKRALQGREGEIALSLRIAELIAVLAANPNGIRGQQLAVALYGDRANSSTLKATVSRARRIIPIEPLPYRIMEGFEADFVRALDFLQEGKVQAALELYQGPLLPESEAPAVVELREHLEESLRQAVLASGDADAMIDLANQQGDDLELWEETRRFLAPNDPRRPLANARIRRIRKRWQSESS